MMTAWTALARFSLAIFMLRCGNTFPRLANRNRRTGLRRHYPSALNRGGSGRIGRPWIVQELSRQPTDLLKIERAKARYPAWRIEIPCIL